jgi:hypothetical protein
MYVAENRKLYFVNGQVLYLLILTFMGLSDSREGSQNFLLHVQKLNKTIKATWKQRLRILIIYDK